MRAGAVDIILIAGVLSFLRCSFICELEEQCNTPFIDTSKIEFQEDQYTLYSTMLQQYIYKLHRLTIYTNLIKILMVRSSFPRSYIII